MFPSLRAMRPATAALDHRAAAVIHRLCHRPLTRESGPTVAALLDRALTLHEKLHRRLVAEETTRALEEAERAQAEAEYWAAIRDER